MEKFSRKEAIQFGWDLAKNNIWFFVKILLTAIIISSVLNFLIGALNFLIEAPRGNMTLAILLSLILMVVNLIIIMGFIKISLNFCYQKQSSIKDLFSYFSYYKLIFTYLVSTIIYILIVLIGLLLLLIPGIIFIIRFQFYPYFIIDKNLGPIESLKKSWQATKGLTWHLFVFNLALSVINFLGFLALIIGIFWTIPTTMLARAFVYTKLLPRLEHQQTETPTTETNVN